MQRHVHLPKPMYSTAWSQFRPSSYDRHKCDIKLCWSRQCQDYTDCWCAPIKYQMPRGIQRPHCRLVAERFHRNFENHWNRGMEDWMFPRKGSKMFKRRCEQTWPSWSWSNKNIYIYINNPNNPQVSASIFFLPKKLAQFCLGAAFPPLPALDHLAQAEDPKDLATLRIWRWICTMPNTLRYHFFERLWKRRQFHERPFF